MGRSVKMPGWILTFLGILCGLGAQPSAAQVRLGPVWTAMQPASDVMRYGYPALAGQPALLLQARYDVRNQPLQPLIKTEKWLARPVPGRLVRITTHGTAFRPRDCDTVEKHAHSLIRACTHALPGWDPTDRFHIPIKHYDNFRLFSQHTGITNRAVCGFTRINNRVIDNPPVHVWNIHDPGDYLPLLRHEMFHAISWHCYGPMPFSIAEGMAEWFGRQGQNNPILQGRREVILRRLHARHVAGQNFLPNYLRCNSPADWHQAFGDIRVGYVIGEQFVDYMLNTTPARRRILYQAMADAYSAKGPVGPGGEAVLSNWFANRQTAFARALHRKVPGGIPTLERDFQAWLHRRVLGP